MPGKHESKRTQQWFDERDPNTTTQWCVIKTKALQQSAID
jgi:hypothetical protein